MANAAKSEKSVAAPSEPKRRYLRNKMNSLETVTWGDGQHALQLPGNSSVELVGKATILPTLADVQRRIRSGEFEIYEA